MFFNERMKFRQSATALLNRVPRVNRTERHFENQVSNLARYIQADLSKGDQARALIEKAGTCDILINNAGIQHVAPIDEFPVEKWDAIIAINLSSAFHTTAAAVTGMRARGYGRIVNIASAHGLTASPYKSAYVAAKHGIVGLTKTVALEAAEYGVTCTRSDSSRGGRSCTGALPSEGCADTSSCPETRSSSEIVIELFSCTHPPSSRIAVADSAARAVRHHREPGVAAVTGRYSHWSPGSAGHEGASRCRRPRPRGRDSVRT